MPCSTNHLWSISFHFRRHLNFWWSRVQKVPRFCYLVHSKTSILHPKHGVKPVIHTQHKTRAHMRQWTSSQNFPLHGALPWLFTDCRLPWTRGQWTWIQPEATTAYTSDDWASSFCPQGESAFGLLLRESWNKRQIVIITIPVVVSKATSHQW
jgi:hypothetical protein